MDDVARFLVFTADEETWKLDRPVIFLGEWCRQFERRDIWEKMDATLATPYGLGKTKIDSNILEAKLIEDRLFPSFYKILNAYHQTQHGERFWKIVLGHWFHEYINTMYNRVNTLESCLTNYKIIGAVGYTSPTNLLAIQRFDPCWYEALESPKWNNLLFTRIFEILEKEHPKIERLSVQSEFNDWCDHLSYGLSKKRRIRGRISQFFKAIAMRFQRDTDAVIFATYLPRLDEIILQMRLKQFPQFYTASMLKEKLTIDNYSRQRLTHQYLDGEEGNLDKVIKSLLFEIIPIAYLEGFSEVAKLADEEKWPKLPKFIFTSNAFYSSDVFKYWIGSKVETGCKYIVGQHGNSYFTDRRQRNSVEEMTPDKFLTWGWTDGSQRYFPSFIFQRLSAKRAIPAKQEGLLLINDGPAVSRTTYDVSLLALSNFEMRQKYIVNLWDEVRRQLTLRLYAGTAKHPFLEKKRWEEFDSKMIIDEGFTPINKLIQKSRLMIFSYDSTGILLALSENIPTLAFWLNGFDHLSDEVIDDYILLQKVGIFHLTPESAANKTNEIWRDVEGWWLQNDVQEARKVFCDKYARQSSHKSKDLFRTLNKLSGDGD